MPYQRKIQAITIDQHTRRLLWNDFELAFHCQRSKQRYSNCWSKIIKIKNTKNAQKIEMLLSTTRSKLQWRCLLNFCGSMIVVHDGKVGCSTVGQINAFTVFWLAVFSIACYNTYYLVPPQLCHVTTTVKREGVFEPRHLQCACCQSQCDHCFRSNCVLASWMIYLFQTASVKCRNFIFIIDKTF